MSIWFWIFFIGWFLFVIYMIVDGLIFDYKQHKANQAMYKQWDDEREEYNKRQKIDRENDKLEHKRIMDSFKCGGCNLSTESHKPNFGTVLECYGELTLCKMDVAFAKITNDEQKLKEAKNKLENLVKKIDGYLK